MPGEDVSALLLIGCYLLISHEDCVTHTGGTKGCSQNG